MTETGSGRSQWAPPREGIAACAVIGALLGVAAVTVATDLPGRVLAGVAGVGLLIFAAMSWRASPKLALTADGLMVRGWFGRHLVTAESITRLRVTEYQRIGRTHRLLEIETRDDLMLILSRWDLGADPRDVFETLSAAGYTGR